MRRTGRFDLHLQAQRMRRRPCHAAASAVLPAHVELMPVCQSTTAVHGAQQWESRQPLHSCGYSAHWLTRCSHSAHAHAPLRRRSGGRLRQRAATAAHHAQLNGSASASCATCWACGRAPPDTLLRQAVLASTAMAAEAGSRSSSGSAGRVPTTSACARAGQRLQHASCHCQSIDVTYSLIPSLDLSTGHDHAAGWHWR